MKKLNNFSIPTVSVCGNSDYYDVNDQYDFKGKEMGWAWVNKKFSSTKRIKKYPNLHEVTYSSFRFKDYIFIGMSGGSSPGHVKSKAFRIHKRKLGKLFKKFSKENKEKRVIFISHNSPYKTKLDLIKDKKAHHHARGKHFGSKLTKRIIEKFQPTLTVSGHIHESFGKDKIKKTLIVNPGSTIEGRFAIININDKNRKIEKVVFHKIK